MRTTSSRALASATLALALTGGALSTCPLAHAQQRSAADIAQARELFNEGTDLRDKGDIAGALEKLRAAHGLAATPITGLELGRTYVSAGKLVEAREVLLGVGRLPVAPQETARSAAARRNAAELAEQVRGRIPKLTVHITGAPLDAVTVTIDGAPVPSDALGAARLVNPGKHDVVAAPTSGERASASLELQESESRSVELHVTLAPPPSPPGGPASTPGSTNAPSAGGHAGLAGADGGMPNEAPSTEQHTGGRVLVYTGFGLAAAGVAVGAVTGFIAMGKASSVNDACQNTLNCPRSVDDDLQTGRTMGNVSTIAFAVAGVGAVVGVVALLTGHKNQAAPTAATWVAPWAAPGGMGLSGGTRF
jgi:hypothetical protein